MALALRYSARSDVGLLREINEDSGYAGPRLLVVADGVGGHAAGEVASSVAVGVLAGLDEDSPGGDLLDRLSTAVHSANSHLRDMVSGDPDLQRHGHHGHRPAPGRLPVRPGARRRLARLPAARRPAAADHPRPHLRADPLDEGRITAEEADHHPQRNLITNALDGREDVELDLSVRETRAGDRYLLCSDGLSDMVSEDTIRDTLAAEASTDVAVERLVELALKGGGPDNITAIVADVVEVETKPPSAVPVTVGAAAVGAVKHERDDTPAAKAAALRPEPEQLDDEYDDDADPGPRRGRRILLLLLLLVVLAGGAFGAWRWSQTQYYVGAEGSQVAIFRGLTQDVGPVQTSRLYRAEDVALADLPTYQQEQVQRRHRHRGPGRRRADRRPAARAGRALPGRRRRGPSPVADPVGHPLAHRLRRAGQPVGHTDARPRRRAPPATTASGSTPATAGAARERPRRRAEPEPAHRPSWSCSSSRWPSRWRPTPRSGWRTTARCPPACSATAAGSRCSSASPTSRCAGSPATPTRSCCRR